MLILIQIMLSPVCLFLPRLLFLYCFAFTPCFTSLIYLCTCILYYIIIWVCITLISLSWPYIFCLMLSLVCLFFFLFLCIPLHLHPSFTSLIYLCMCRYIYIPKNLFPRLFVVKHSRPWEQSWKKISGMNDIKTTCIAACLNAESSPGGDSVVLGIVFFFPHLLGSWSPPVPLWKHLCRR